MEPDPSPEPKVSRFCASSGVLKWRFTQELSFHLVWKGERNYLFSWLRRKVSGYLLGNGDDIFGIWWYGFSPRLQSFWRLACYAKSQNECLSYKLRDRKKNLPTWRAIAGRLAPAEIDFLWCAKCHGAATILRAERMNQFSKQEGQWHHRAARDTRRTKINSLSLYPYPSVCLCVRVFVSLSDEPLLQHTHTHYFLSHLPPSLTFNCLHYWERRNKADGFFTESNTHTHTESRKRAEALLLPQIEQSN